MKHTPEETLLWVCEEVAAITKRHTKLIQSSGLYFAHLDLREIESEFEEEMCRLSAEIKMRMREMQP